MNCLVSSLTRGQRVTRSVVDKLAALRALALGALLLGTSVLGVGAPTSARAASVAPGPGYSAYWYNPERSGSGLALEVLSEELVVLYWFTYDGAGRQRWVTGVGTVEHDAAGAFIDLPQLVAPRGGHFGEPFDLGNEDKPVVGAATLRFAGCDAGTFSYSAFGQSASIEVQRLTQTMGSAGCWPYNGVPGKPVQAWAGQSGAWYDPERSGAGMSLQWLYNGLAVLTWYTFDDEGHPYWIQGVGQRQDDRIVFPELYTTSGAHFGQGFDSNDVVTTEWGSLSLELECARGSAHYQSILPEFGSGNLDLIHLTRLLRPACPYAKPKFTDLYQLTWTEIPDPTEVPEPPPGAQSVSFQPYDIADDGTIVASMAPRDEYDNTVDGRVRMALWHPDIGEWQTVDRDLSGVGPGFSSDGSRALAADLVDGHQVPFVWVEGAGWKVLPGLGLVDSWPTGASDDLSWIVGYGTNDGSHDNGRLWIWDIEHGQAILPVGPYNNRPGTVMTDIANDGSVAIGSRNAIYSSGPGIVWERQVDGQMLGHLIRDDRGHLLGEAHLCDRNCSIVFGVGQEGALISEHHPGEPWLWSSTGAFGYLEQPLPIGAWSPNRTRFKGVTANGSMLVGTGSAYTGDPGDPGDYIPYFAFLWTQRTGTVPVASILEDQGITSDPHAFAPIAITSTGDRILGALDDAASPHGFRTVVLGLTPKQGVPGQPAQ